MDRHIFLCKYTHRYNMYVSVLVILLKYVFRDENLVLDDQFVCSSPGKTISPTLNILELSIVCVGLVPCGHFSVHFGICLLASSLFSSSLSNHVGRICLRK